MRSVGRCRSGSGVADVAAAMRRCAVFLLIAAAVASCAFASGCAGHAPVARERQATAVSFDGSRIAYGVRGEGEPCIVFIHGWLCSREMWRPQVEYFSEEHKVIWLDLAAHGDSGSARDAYSVAAYGRDVQAVVDREALGEIVLVGHSMGGNVAIEAARLLGGRVAAIVAVDTFHTPLSRVPTAKKLQFLAWLEAEYPAALRATVESMFPPGIDSAVVDSTFEAMLAPDRRVGIDSLRELILWNDRDAAAGLREFSDRLHCINAGEPGEKPSGEDVVLIPGSGHFVARIKPKAFNVALEAILENRLAD